MNLLEKKLLLVSLMLPSWLSLGLAGQAAGRQKPAFISPSTIVE